MNSQAKQAETEDEKSTSLGTIILDEIKFLIGLFGFIVVFFTLIWGHYKIPSESMQPTLEVGDHLYVSKFAYGYSKHSLPFGLSKLPLPEGKIFSRAPKRSDVAVFSDPNHGTILIKRVVGLPGDTILVKGGRLFLNGEIVARETVGNYLYREHKAARWEQGGAPKSRRFTLFAWPKGRPVGVDVYRETLPGTDATHRIYEQTDSGRLDNVGPFTVPEGHVFMMGDNRDNSDDSRAANGPGMVPFDHLIGRADLMMYSFKRCPAEEGLYCPPARWAKRL